MAFQIIQIPDLPVASTVAPTDQHIIETSTGTKSVRQSVLDNYNASNFIKKNVNDTTSGVITAAGFTSSSSIKYKESLRFLCNNELQSIMKLLPYLYRYKSDSPVKPGQDDIGLIAEEVDAIYPLLVTKDENGQIQGIDYAKLSVYILKAVQELATKVQELQSHTAYLI